jgi:hypothetical protein
LSSCPANLASEPERDVNAARLLDNYLKDARRQRRIGKVVLDAEQTPRIAPRRTSITNALILCVQRTLFHNRPTEPDCCFTPDQLSSTMSQLTIAALPNDDEYIRRDGAPPVPYTVTQVRKAPLPLRAQRTEEILSTHSAGAYCVGGGGLYSNVVKVSFRGEHGDVQHITLKEKATRGSVKFWQEDEHLEFTKLEHVVKYWMHVTELKQHVDSLNKAREHAAALQEILREANAAVIGGAGTSAASLIAASINLWYNGDTVDSELSLEQWLECWRSQTSALRQATETALSISETNVTAVVTAVDAIHAEVRVCYMRVPQNIANRLVCDLETLAKRS